MTNKYPEISANETKSIVVAPGEGKIPKDIMSEEEWDIKAFPHLHNPDGSNGKDTERSTRLTEQNYFIQRLCNIEQRFAKSSAYMYAALGYIEKKQLQRNINLAYTRGKEVKGESGEKRYELDDGYRVLDSITNTPRYWKQAKYEMLAKLDNLGPFHLFFTLSCADMRWDENFASILRDKGYHIKYQLIKDDEGNWDTVVEGRTTKGEWKPIKNFIKEDVQESLHELLRGNVITAARYYQHRVKNFISKVMMGKSNPMNVKYYTYKVEFQDRGAGHIHGTLWLNLKKIENMVKDENGEWKQIPKENKEDKLNIKEDDRVKSPFHGLESTFKVLRGENKVLKKDQ